MYAEDVISIVEKYQVDTFFQALNSVDLHMNFTMESYDTDMVAYHSLTLSISPAKITPSKLQSIEN